MQLQPLTFDKLKGIQTRKALSAFDPSEALSCIGGYFDVTGAFTKRRGGEKYNTTPLPSFIGGIYDFRYSNDTQQKILIASDTDMYDGNGGVPASIQSGLTADKFYDFVTYNDLAWWVNGADKMFKYDGTTVTEAGIARPVAAPLAAGVNGAGSLALGTYLIRFTYENALGEESNPSDQVSITLVGLEDTINLSGVSISPDTQVTKRNIYITLVGGGVLFYKQSINDNATTVDTILNTNNLGKLLEYDHDTPPEDLVGIEIHKDRIFGFKDNVLYFSKDFDVWYWPQGELDQEKQFFAQVGNSDPITAMKSFYDVLLIWKSYDVYVLSGDNELNFRIDRVRSDERVGAVSDRAIRVIGNYCYFLGANSVYRTNGITIDEVGDPIGDFFDQNSKSTVYKVNKQYFQSACAEYFKELNLFLLFIPTGTETDNNMCFVMDTNSVLTDPASGKLRPDWLPWPGFTSQSAAIIVENGSEKWFRGDSFGYVFRQETLDGDGSNITATSTGANTNATLNDTNQAWTVNLYAGLRVNILRGTGADQERIIVSNTADELTVTPIWTTTPDDTSVYTIGGPPYHYAHSWNDYGSRSLSKRWRYSRPIFETSGNYNINVYYGYDFAQVNADMVLYSITGIALWDSAFWDVDVWDGTAIIDTKLSMPGNRIHRWSNFKIENNAAGQPVKYMGVDKLWQLKGVR